MKIQTKTNGKILILSTITLILLYALFLDTIILLLTITTILIIIYPLLTTILKIRQLEKKITITPNNIQLRLIADTTKTTEIQIKTPKPIKTLIQHPIKFCQTKPQEYTTNNKITIEISPKKAGIYTSEYLEAQTNTPLKTFTIKTKIPFKTHITVIPRVIPVAIRALELATTLGMTTYETPAEPIGKGTEYAETREYTPGDDLRHIDWKATARTQKLMIKQFHQDTGGTINIIYDTKTAGPITKDKIATEFLKTIITLITQNTPYTITIIDQQNNTKTLKSNNKTKALLTAIKIALQTIETDYTILYELIQPQTIKDTIALLKTIETQIQEEKTPQPQITDTIAITCLLGDLTWLMNTHQTLTTHNKTLTIYTPSKIWLDSKTLEQAYIDYTRQIKLTTTLKKRGIQIKTQ
ncbi:MAG: DUF58 domain-containing protein [Thermoprotei archaeon]